ncbi:MAG: hypothetical protein ACFFAN_17240 [Promethearchaeota archaeon]
MVKEKKLLKKSKFIKSIKALINDINGKKTISESHLYSSRDDFVDKIFELIMRKSNTEVIKKKG